MLTCDDAEILAHAPIDDELDAAHTRDVEAHVAACPRCAARLATYRDLHARLAAGHLRPATPVGLRAKIDAALPRPEPAGVGALASRRAMLKGVGLGAAASAFAAASLLFVMARDDRDARLLNEAISAHLRSLQAEHLTDVPSSDQHTVKPWFSGRLDIAPPVADLTAQGFILLGGRLDYVGGKAVAALVYRRRRHVINLFMGESLSISPGVDAMRGFNIRSWTEQGFGLVAISDLAGKELQEFTDKFRAATNPIR